jgi:hypothetical protein
MANQNNTLAEHITQNRRNLQKAGLLAQHSHHEG